MSVNFRFPSITAGTDKEQLTQIKSYLHQLVEQLNYALPTMGSGSAQTIEVQGGEMSYYELRSLIIQTLQDVEKRFDQLSAKVESDIEASLTEAKESGEFDGPPGPKGEKGDPGESGVDFVTDIGTENGWSYKKWNSGSYEMFGEFTVKTTTICTDMGSMFCSEEFSLPTPFAIDRAIVSSSADDLFLIASGGRSSVDADTNISFVLLRPFSFDTSMEIIVRLHVTGTYHQGGTE